MTRPVRRDTRPRRGLARADGRRRRIALLAAGLVLAAACAVPLAGQVRAADALPREVRRIPLPGASGRLDHLALDARGARLFVAGVASGGLEVVDLRAGAVNRVSGFHEPQGVLFHAAGRKLFVTEGAARRLAILDADALRRVGAAPLRDDPDNVRYEAGADRVWVGEGERGAGALAEVAAATGELVAEVALDGHPEAFELEARGGRVFVDVPSAHEVQVVDRERRVVTARWTPPCEANFPMALDEEHRRLLVGCRRPAKIAVLDTDTGRAVSELDAPADADDLFLDPARGRLYACAGAGVVRVYERRDGGFGTLGDVRTGPGARTCLFDPGSQRLYVAVPRRGSAVAEIVELDAS